MLLFLPLLQHSKGMGSAKAVTETEMAVDLPDTPQDWQGALEHHAPEQNDLVLH